MDGWSIWYGVWALTAYVVMVNMLTFELFSIDKRRAERGEWRISESTLLFMAGCGGALACKYAQRRLRHKTRKQPFAAMLNTILVGQLLFAAFGLVSSIFLVVLDMPLRSMVWSVEQADRLTDPGTPNAIRMPPAKPIQISR